MRLFSSQSEGGAILLSSPALSMRLLVFSGGRGGYLFLKSSPFDEALLFSVGRRGYLFLKSSPFDEALGLLRREGGLSFYQVQPFR